jgi:hypothetical protein
MCDMTVGHHESSKQFLQNGMRLVAVALAHDRRQAEAAIAALRRSFASESNQQ